MARRHAVVVGGGVAGPVVALALQRVGIDASIHEARERDDGVGSFLTVASNGMEALRAVGAAEAVAAAGIATPRMVMWSGTGRRLGEVPNGVVLPDGLTSTTIHRADLHRVLLTRARTAGIAVHRGARLVSTTRTGAGVEATFSDGSVAAGDLLVGADGVHSRTRSLVDPAAPRARFGGLLSIGGRATGVDLPRDPGVFHMIFGRRAFFGYTGGDGGPAWWFANLPVAREPSRELLAGADDAAWRRRLSDAFADDAGPATALIAATSGELGAYATHDLPTVPRWSGDRMVLVGDAAHATSPSGGQGAAQAIESAITLARCLRDVDGVDAAIAAYVAERRPRVERVVRYSARLSNSKAAGPVGRRVRDAVLPLFLRRFANAEAAAWLYDHDVAFDRGPARGATP